ncbi:Oligopeptide-binding protein OppA precursor [Caloramator mitchellensis]|uniref:Oligopeptide-binding protein OppA n=2 Tax=Caloramator mitchellensis TaxID=908809 RepID=A0A0R3JRT8_CALMK|nr:Oligopeptide-binding protein OppA precursor [Caloramator mitchellensis]
MKKAKLLIVLAVVLALGVSLFAGCAKGGGAGQTIKYNLGAEPATIDPQLNSAVDGATVIVNTFDGLTRLDASDKPVAAMAEKWEVSADGLTYKFFLRKDAKWTDGQPVKAQDFVYAWQRAVDPATASEYAYQVWYVKNGQAISEGKMAVDQLGVKAIDDTTLEVTLEAPTAYFLSLTAFPTYMPVRKDVVEKDPQGWATKPETYVSNGPFKLKEWRPKDAIVLEKNPNWYNADKVKFSTIEMKMIEDQTSSLAAFKSGQLDYIESPPSAEIPNLLASGDAKIFPYLGTYFYIFNLSPNAAKVDPAAAKAISDVRVRKAFALAIDRKAIVENVTKGGQLTATSFVPNGIPDADGSDFKKKDYYPAEGNVEEAKKLLAEAGYPDGKGFPKITLMYNTSQGHQAIAMAMQDMLKKNLGVEVELANQEWKVFQKTRNDKNYIFARHGWIADYVDPMTFLDMWITNGGQNNIGYSNPEYDKRIEAAKKEADPAKRMQLLHEAEDILMNDMPLIPIYYYTNVACIKPYVKDVHKSALGFVYFEYGYIEK